jgi:hypothetical protein
MWAKVEVFLDIVSLLLITSYSYLLQKIVMFPHQSVENVAQVFFLTTTSAKYDFTVDGMGCIKRAPVQQSRDLLNSSAIFDSRMSRQTQR